MGNYRLGIPIDVLTAPVADAEDLIKAREGFGRGSKAHKYWKRVRRVVSGKVQWVYYYDTPASRKRWFEERAKKVKHARKKVEALEELHKEKADFKADHPELKEARKDLSDLSKEYVTELLGWTKPPRIKLSDEAMNEFHKQIISSYGEQPEGEDPHGKALSVMRTMEMGFDRMPPSIKKHFSGAISELVMARTEEDSYLKKKMGVAGYCEWPKKGKGSRVVVDMNRSQAAAMARGHHMKGGLFPVEVLVHEMAHAIHNQIGAKHAPIYNEGWPGPTFKDFERFMADEGRFEKGVTQYAETNYFERWAESFTAALMYPRQLATEAPKMYEWFQGFFGEEAMRPLYTDQGKIDSLTKQRNKAISDGDLATASELDHKIDMATGVLDMPADDVRLQWWRKKDTHVQRQLNAEKRRVREQGDPWADVYEHKEDKFYELAVGGRKIFFRMGKQNRDDDFSGWEPTSRGKRKTAGTQVKIGEIKEVYDDEGNPITTDMAYWHLFQDELTDDHPKAADLQSFSDPDGKDNKLSTNGMRMMLDRLARQGAQGFPGGARTPWSKARAPVEVSEEHFCLTSLIRKSGRNCFANSVRRCRSWSFSKPPVVARRASRRQTSTWAFTLRRTRMVDRRWAGSRKPSPCWRSTLIRSSAISLCLCWERSAT
jgi:hypothetical protein